MDVESRRRWEAYTKAMEAMLERISIPEAPWWLVEAVDKKHARLNCIEHLLTTIPYDVVEHDDIILPERDHSPDYVRKPMLRACTSPRLEGAPLQSSRQRLIRADQWPMPCPVG